MLTEILSSMWQGFRDRLRNPLIGAFVIAWLLWNWPVVLLAFSDLGVEQRIDAIHEHVQHFSSFIAPGVLAVLYVLLMPWVSFAVQRITTHVKEEQQKHKYTSEANILTNQLAAVQKESEIERARFHHSVEVMSLKQEYVAEQNRLSEEVSRLEGELADVQAEKSRVLQEKLKAEDRVRIEEARVKQLKAEHEIRKEGHHLPDRPASD